MSLRLLSIGFALLLTGCSSASAFNYEDDAFDQPYAVSSLQAVPLAASATPPHFDVSLSPTMAAYAKGRTAFAIPILMYHYIRPMPPKTDKTGQGLTVTPQTFAAQLDYLTQKGYHSVTFADVANTGAVLPTKPIILTFDDGYQDAFDQAFPILLAHNMRGVFYVISGFPGKPNYATWDELLQMVTAHMEIGAHSVRHFDLAKMSLAMQKKEIDDSIATIEKQLNIRLISFAYPSGKYNADSLGILRKADIPFAVTTHGGVMHAESNRLELPRVRMTEKIEMKKFF